MFPFRSPWRSRWLVLPIPKKFSCGSSEHCDTHGERKLIGHDRVETLEFQRPKLRVRVTLYPKYACPNEASCGVASPPREESLVEGNRYDTSVAAEIITGKYGYHLPIYRQQDYFAGSGWTPGRSTLLNILRASALLIVPLFQFFRDEWDLRAVRRWLGCREGEAVLYGNPGPCD